MRDILCGESGQATIEAAFALPVLMLLILLLLQPAIVLYDRTVMQAAAAEGCRLLATSPSGREDVNEDYIRRRLSAVPQQDLFHVHADDACSWDIALEGNETSTNVCVTISNEIKPLPLLDAGATLLGLANDAGNLEISVQVSSDTQPQWVGSGASIYDPNGWVGAWAS